MQWYTSENGFCSSRRRNDSAQSNNFARSIAVSILRTHYPSGRTWANISYFVWVMRLQYKDGHETHYASRRATFRSASFKTYFEEKFVQTHNASCARLYT